MESSGVNVLVIVVNVQAQGRIKNHITHFFHERIHDVPADYILGLPPETKDVVRSEAFKHIGHGFRFVRTRRKCSSKHLVQIREKSRFYAIYALKARESVTELSQQFCNCTHCISVTNAHLPEFALET